MKLSYSFIIPVYNRPDEVDELLMSLARQDFSEAFEVVIVEDGSSITSEDIVRSYSKELDVSYYYKSNSGPGDSRNYGMNKAKGNYFIILDSDCILPPSYLTTVNNSLQQNFVACFGGPDAAHKEFTNLQKAINYAMTSFLTTGGIRGNSEKIDKFQPRSFNMGLSKEAYLATNGFGKIHPGEDPDLTIRLWKLGFKTKLIKEAFVYHKRRISWKKFYQQVHKFGLCRPILNLWHPTTKKITYWFPTIFIVGLITSIVIALLFNNYLFLSCYGLYFISIFIHSLVINKHLGIALMSLIAVMIQFFGYGYGFLKSTLKLSLSKRKPEEVFPKLFFK